LALVNQLKRYGEYLSDARAVEKNCSLIRSQSNYNFAVIKESVDLDFMIIDQLMGSLQAHEENVERKK
jgi:hypothetical protein